MTLVEVLTSLTIGVTGGWFMDGVEDEHWLRPPAWQTAVAGNSQGGGESITLPNAPELRYG